MNTQSPELKRKSATNARKDISSFLLLYCISRAIILFMPVSLLDQDKIYDLQSFPNLIAYSAINPVYPYPILFSIQLSSIFFLFGATMVGYRIGMMLYEVGTLVILYKFVLCFQMQENQKTPPGATRNAIVGCYLLAFSPLTIFSFMGSSEFPAIFFMILGLYAYYKNKSIWASLILGLGFLTEFFPIFCLVPILLHALVKKDVKNLAKLIIPFIILFLLINAPYFLSDPLSIVASYADQLSQNTMTFSLWNLFGSELPTWNLFSIQISPVILAFATFIAIFCYFTIQFFRKHKFAAKIQDILFILLLTLLLPIVFLSLIPFYFFFGFPLVCLFIESKTTIRWQKDFSTIITIFIVPFAIANTILWPYLYFKTPPEGGNSVAGNFLFYSIIGIFFLGIAVLWASQAKQWAFYRPRENKPSIFQLLIGVFFIFIIQFVIPFFTINIPFLNPLSPILFAVFLIGGIIFILWNAKKIYAVIKMSLPLPIVEKRMDSAGFEPATS